MSESFDHGEISETQRIIEESRQARREAEQARLGLAKFREALAEQRRRARRAGSDLKRSVPESLEQIDGG